MHQKVHFIGQNRLFRHKMPKNTRLGPDMSHFRSRNSRNSRNSLEFPSRITDVQGGFDRKRAFLALFRPFRASRGVPGPGNKPLEARGGLQGAPPRTSPGGPRRAPRALQKKARGGPRGLQGAPRWRPPRRDQGPCETGKKKRRQVGCKGPPQGARQPTGQPCPPSLN